jgi:hypothetical protein
MSTLAQNDFQDGVLSRTDMIAIFRQVEKAGSLTSQEFTDLKTLVGDAPLFVGVAYVQQLSQDVVTGNVANAHYLGATLGNLAVGFSAANLEKLVDKWFLGTDHPVATSDWVGTNGKDETFTYRQVSGQLFVNGVAYTDIRQGGIGDCYFLSSLAETALKNPTAITSMFIVNGDGTYTVRFMHGTQAAYVTVDSQLPTDASGYLVFDGMGQRASSSTNELWVALAEKAYVELNECGWTRFGQTGNGKNVYNAISGGDMSIALTQITGHAATDGYLGGITFATFASYVSKGESICLGSDNSPANSQIVGDHAYAVLSIDTLHQTVTLFNPWGLNNGHDSGVITLTWVQLEQSFDFLSRTT